MAAPVLVTRPAHDAQPWVEALGRHGLRAQALPLIAIGPCTDPGHSRALQAARAAVQGQAGMPPAYRAVMFVSGNAVQHFFGNGPARLDPQLRAWTPGPGTAQALQARGIAASQIDGPPADAAQFESETLWQGVQAQVRPGDRVLIVRGDGPAPTEVPLPARPRTGGAGRDWLAARLREAGADVELLAVYRRSLPDWDDLQRQRARQAADDGTVWLFSSSEAVANLQQFLPQQSWQQGRALATHERIARQAARIGFGWVGQCRPALEDVVASIESLHEL
jgi:uroporphyrinogen-III synthase